MKNRLAFTLTAFLAVLFCSCSIEPLPKTRPAIFTGIFALPEYTFKGDYVEIDIQGYGTIISEVYYVAHGINSKSFQVPTGVFTVTRAEVFKDGEVTYKAMPLDSLGSRNGLVVSGVPVRVWDGDIVQQIFK